MKANEIREKYLKFFEKKGHKVIPSASLIPENDPTVLFTTAGMHPLVPYLLGQKHALGKRLVNVQKCLRTGDIDEVGDATHNTFFEMLGNWSLGDYFKKQAIEWSFEFLTKELKIPLEKLAVSVFKGEGTVPKDEESFSLWKNLGISEKRIAFLGKEDNWWGPAGKTGPCGPDTEMFYYVGGKPPLAFNPDDEKWVEIWNDVFMEYNKTEKGEFVLLKQKNVDTGMGLERVTAVLQGKESVYETELFLPIIGRVRELISKKDTKAERIIADHIKASIFILSEKIYPANTERGYVLRRLIRRALWQGLLLGAKIVPRVSTSESYFAESVADSVFDIYGHVYPELLAAKDFISGRLHKEEEKFSIAVKRALAIFEKLRHKGRLSGKEAFDLYQSHGLPIEITKELAKNYGIEIDQEGFRKNLEKHKEISSSSSSASFKSGLADSSEKTVKYHTATHLLHAALRQVLGKEVKQMGSNITSARLRFDFSFERKLKPEEIEKVEKIVNDQIKQGLEIKVEEMPKEKALSEVDVAFFKERYPDKVKVYTIFNPKTKEVFSKEICSGPHTAADLGVFKIIKQEACSAGVRRIRAVLE